MQQSLRRQDQHPVTLAAVLLLAACDAGANKNCNVSDVRFATRKDGWAMLVATTGRNCDGGTASTSEEHVYELAGTTLKLVHRLEAHYH